jgi:hypothetical protein
MPRTRPPAICIAAAFGRNHDQPPRPFERAASASACENSNRSAEPWSPGAPEVRMICTWGARRVGCADPGRVRSSSSAEQCGQSLLPRSAWATIVQPSAPQTLTLAMPFA